MIVDIDELEVPSKTYERAKAGDTAALEELRWRVNGAIRAQPYAVKPGWEAKQVKVTIKELWYLGVITSIKISVL